jgi:hypothetical protein
LLQSGPPGRAALESALALCLACGIGGVTVARSQDAEAADSVALNVVGALVVALAGAAVTALVVPLVMALRSQREKRREL